MLDVVQPALERVANPASLDSDAAVQVSIGVRSYGILRSSTDALIMHVDRGVRTLDEIKGRFLAALVELFPEAEFLQFKLLENPAPSIFDEKLRAEIIAEALTQKAPGHL